MRRSRRDEFSQIGGKGVSVMVGCGLQENNFFNISFRVFFRIYYYLYTDGLIIIIIIITI